MNLRNKTKLEFRTVCVSPLGVPNSLDSLYLELKRRRVAQSARGAIKYLRKLPSKELKDKIKLLLFYVLLYTPEKCPYIRLPLLYNTMSTTQLFSQSIYSSVFLCLRNFEGYRTSSTLYFSVSQQLQSFRLTCESNSIQKKSLTHATGSP